MRKIIIAAVLAAIALPSVPAFAIPQASRDQSREDQRDRRDDRRDDQREARDDRRDDHRDGVRNQRDHRREVQRTHRENVRDRRQAQRDRARSAQAWRNYNRYDYNRPDPTYGRYEANRYYRDGSYYQTRTMRRGERVYRGNDDRYYCRRNDGTTGLIIGGIGGGVLGNVIAPGESKTIGTVLGAGLGALLGREVDRGEVRCR